MQHVPIPQTSGPAGRALAASRPTMILAALLCLALSSPAAAEIFCAPREHIIASVTEDRGERRQSYGLSHQNTLVEVYASDKSGTWTLLFTGPRGVSCVLARGNFFEAEHLPTPSGAPL